MDDATPLPGRPGAMTTTTVADSIDVMGVLNVTPDSFSDGGEHLRPTAAAERAMQMVREGARVIDVGGESTRPGALPVDPLDEQRRVLPVIEAIADGLRSSGVRVSIDTRHASTARAAVAAGATLINDVGATLWPVAAELGVGWVAMHMFGDPRTMQAEPRYVDVVDDVRAFLVGRAAAAAGGVDEIWVDPGIGFGKTTAHNLQLLAHLDLLVDEGFPVLVGTSRKRFLGELIALSDAGPAADGRPRPTPDDRQMLEPVGVRDRVDGSLATEMWAMIHGARMVRVHDVDVAVQGALVATGSIPVR